MATLITLVNFNGTNGSGANGGLTLDGTGDLFGTTALGGLDDEGTLFEIVNTNGSYASRSANSASRT